VVVPRRTVVHEIVEWLRIRVSGVAHQACGDEQRRAGGGARWQPGCREDALGAGVGTVLERP
jgi:hypothetical protein